VTLKIQKNYKRTWREIKIKILNLFSGIGGNRTFWGDDLENQPNKDPLENTWLILQKHLKKPIDEFIYYFNLKYKNQSIMGLKLKAKSINDLKLDLPIFLLNLNWRPD